MSIGIMNLVDALEIGGLERVAVNLANQAAQSGYRSYLCATRSGGPLADSVNSDVQLLTLGRQHRFDPGPITRLRRFIVENRVQILHAHGSALFAARIAALGLPRTSVIWHAHYGRLAQSNASLAWRLAARGVSAVIPVSKLLADWSEKSLSVNRKRIHYVPNFVVTGSRTALVSLEGKPGYRCVCVANDRPEKGLDILQEAFAKVRAAIPEAHLFIVGRPGNGLRGNAPGITLLGPRNDVPAILASCDLGILSSRVEGLPLALLEYGAAGLGSVCTRVGDCEEVSRGGEAAVLVSPSSPDELAAAIANLLQSPIRRLALGAALRQHVSRRYSVEAAWKTLQPIYENLACPEMVAA